MGKQPWNNYGEISMENHGKLMESCSYQNVSHQFFTSFPRKILPHLTGEKLDASAEFDETKNGEISSALHGAGINISTFRLPSGSLT